VAPRAIINKVLRFVRLVENNNIPVSKAILFGSYAKDQHTKESDIDVCLVSDAFRGWGIEQEISLSILASQIDHRIEAIAITSAKYNKDVLSPLIHEIKKTGQVIYGRKKQSVSTKKRAG
jgi:uncharacterized protein